MRDQPISQAALLAISQNSHEEMHGGWDSQHIHSQAAAISAPDKEQAEMQYNMLD